jgi:hypothetical protein
MKLNCDFTSRILKRKIRLPLSCDVNTFVILYDVNDVKYGIKRQKYPCDFTPTWVFLCDFTPQPDYNNCSWFYMKFWISFQKLFNFKFCICIPPISMKILEILLNFRIPTSYSFIFIKFKQHFTALFHNTQEEYIISQLHSGELKMSCLGSLARTIAWSVCSNDKKTQKWSVSVNDTSFWLPLWPCPLASPQVLALLNSF